MRDKTIFADLLTRKKKPRRARATFEVYVLFNSGESCTWTGTKKACMGQYKEYVGSPFIEEVFVERMATNEETQTVAYWKSGGDA